MLNALKLIIYGSTKTNDSMRQLHDVMTSMSKRAIERSESQVTGHAEVDSICKLANSMTDMMKVKVSAVKVARVLLRDMKRKG